MAADGLSNEVMPLLANLEDFVQDRRPHGPLTADATDPAGLDTVVMASHTHSNRAHHS